MGPVSFPIRKPPVIIKMFYFQDVLRLSPRCFIFQKDVSKVSKHLQDVLKFQKMFQSFKNIFLKNKTSFECFKTSFRYLNYPQRCPMNCQMFWLEDVLICKMFWIFKTSSRCFNTCKRCFKQCFVYKMFQVLKHLLTKHLLKHQVRSSCFANLKGTVGLIMVRSSVMRVEIPLDLSSRSWLSVTYWVFYCSLSLVIVLIIVLVWHLPFLGLRLFSFCWK